MIATTMSTGHWPAAFAGAFVILTAAAAGTAKLLRAVREVLGEVRALHAPLEQVNTAVNHRSDGQATLIEIGDELRATSRETTRGLAWLRTAVNDLRAGQDSQAGRLEQLEHFAAELRHRHEQDAEIDLLARQGRIDRRKTQEESP